MTPPADVEGDGAAASRSGEGGSTRRRAARRLWLPELPPWTALVLGGPMLAAFAFLVFYPAVELFVTSLESGVAGYRQLFEGPEWRAIKTTLWVSGLVTALCLVLGAVVAWTLRTARSRAVASLFWIAILSSLSMSVVVKNYAFFTILGRFGFVNWALEAMHLPTWETLFTPTAVVLGMVYSLLPLAIFPLYVTFRAVPDDLLRAAESLGGTWWQTMSTVVLPLSVPGFFITGVLLFVFSLGFFVTPVVLGGPSSTFLAAMIRQDITRTFDQPAAAVKSVFLIVVALALVAAAVKLVGKDRFERALG